MRFWRSNLILQSKNSVEKVLHVLFEPIASFIPPPNTHSHGHTATHPYQVPHCSIIQGADAGVAVTAVASRSKSAWRIPSSARQQRVSHDGSSAWYRSYAANNGCACYSFGGSRLSATPRTYLWRLSAKPKATKSLGRGFVEPLLSERAPEAQSCQPISTAVQQYSRTPNASRKSTKTKKCTRLTIRRRTRRFQSKTNPAEKGRFRPAESDCIRNGTDLLGPATPKAIGGYVYMAKYTDHCSRV